jgi:hypothetical protein
MSAMAADLATRIEQIFDKQFAEGQRMLASHMFPDHIARSVLVAANMAREAVGDVPSGAFDLAAARARVAAALERFRDLDDDEDGYGAATFHELGAALHGLESGG